MTNQQYLERIDLNEELRLAKTAPAYQPDPALFVYAEQYEREQAEVGRWEQLFEQVMQ